ncbi:hypothetical protein LINPERHAP2_LOCUS17637, partial [Linum perenne]
MIRQLLLTIFLPPMRRKSRQRRRTGYATVYPRKAVTEAVNRRRIRIIDGYATVLDPD